MHKKIVLSLLLILYSLSCSHKIDNHKPLKVDEEVKGWIILSDNLQENMFVIDNASKYEINHLQLSHDLIHDLRHVRILERLEKANKLIEHAHAKGIQEVVLWDRSLYNLDYYPERFRTGPNGTIDLDNPAFWEWFKDDYRQMLDLVPNIQGLILTLDLQTYLRHKVKRHF